MTRREKILKISIILLSILLSVAIILNKDKLENLQQYGLVGIFLISVIGNATIVIPTPVVLTAFVGGGVFNPLLVGLVSALGATVGELTSYIAGASGKGFVEKNKNFQKIESLMKRHGFLTIFFLAVVPNPLFDIAGICAGITKYPIKRYVLATFLGKTVKFIVIALLGARIF